MPTIEELAAKDASRFIGRPIRVDFVKGALKKCPSLFGNLCTVDPESHSVVLAQFGLQEPSSATSSNKLLLISGDSIQNIQILEDPVSVKDDVSEDGQQQSTSSSLQNTLGNSMIENSAKLQEKLDKIFLPCGATIKDGEKPESVQRSDSTACSVDSQKRRRSPTETVKIFDEFVLAKRRRVIDVLNKKGVKFKEIPFSMVGKKSRGKKAADEREDASSSSAADVNTVLMLGRGGSVRIFPPYGKEQITGSSAVDVRKLTAMLVIEGLFNNDD